MQLREREKERERERVRERVRERQGFCLAPMLVAVACQEGSPVFVEV